MNFMDDSLFGVNTKDELMMTTESSATQTVTFQVTRRTKKPCITTEEYKKMSPEELFDPLFYKLHGKPCEYIDSFQQIPMVCGFYTCYSEELQAKVKYPHDKCFKMYPGNPTRYQSVWLANQKRHLQHLYPNASIETLFRYKVEYTGEIDFCSKGKLKSNWLCYASRSKQLLVLWLRFKLDFLQTYYNAFYERTPTLSYKTLDYKFYGYIFRVFKMYISLFGMVLAVLFGILNIAVVKRVLNESTDSAARVYHYSETCLDTAQIFVSGLAGMNWDRFLQPLWVDLCGHLTPIFDTSESENLNQGGANPTFIGEPLAWGLLVPGQLAYVLLIKDRFKAVSKPLQYNNQGPGAGKKAKKIIISATVAFICLSLAEILVVNVVQEKKGLLSDRIRHIPYVDFFKLPLKFLNFITILLLLIAQMWYSIRTLVSWYIYQKDALKHAVGDQQIEDAKAELAKFKQKLLLILGTCTLNLISTTPWVMNELLRTSDILCTTYRFLTYHPPIVEKTSIAFLSDSCIPSRKYLNGRSVDRLAESLALVWPLFLILNCFSVIVHIICTKTYKTELLKMVKNCCKKNNQVSPSESDQLRRSSKMIHPSELNEAPRNEQLLNEVPKSEQPLNEVPKSEQPLNEVPKSEQPLNEVPKSEQSLNEVPKSEQMVNHRSQTIPCSNEVPTNEQPLNEAPKKMPHVHRVQAWVEESM